MDSENGEVGVRYTYSWPIAFIFVFNLIVGAGALTLPKAFAQTGWFLGLLGITVLGLMSYCTSTFMVEAMSIANAVMRCKPGEKESNSPDDAPPGDDENDADILNTGPVDTGDIATSSASRPVIIKSGHSVDDTGSNHSNDLLNPIEYNYTHDFLYEIDSKVEMGEMAKMFFNRIGLLLYYIVISLYLFGDLAIYAAAVPKSMTTTVCGDAHAFDGDTTMLCGSMKNIRVIDMYRIMLIVFTATLGPFVFLNISKTKFLQMLTTTFRWLAFTAMVILACLKIRKNEKTHHAEIFKFNQLPNFFGVAVYSFMCQHSLPSILTPVSNKKYLNRVLLSDFLLTASFYTLLALTATFAFPVNEMEDLYTLNFTSPVFLRYFLELFPVFTLSTNFPIIGITLRENLKTLFLKNDRHYGLFVRSYLFPLITIIPPIAIAYSTYNVGMLVSITGTYAGAVIQYIIPSMLVYFGRTRMENSLGSSVNKHRSPLGHNFFIFVVVGWYTLCVIFVTVNMITSK